MFVFIIKINITVELHFYFHIHSLQVLTQSGQGCLAEEVLEDKKSIHTMKWMHRKRRDCGHKRVKFLDQASLQSVLVPTLEPENRN